MPCRLHLMQGCAAIQREGYERVARGVRRDAPPMPTTLILPNTIFQIAFSKSGFWPCIDPMPNKSEES